MPSIRPFLAPTALLLLASESLRAQEPESEPQALEPEGLELAGAAGGWRQQLDERGITLGFSAILELNRVLSGGLRQETSGHALYDLSLGFDLARIAGIEDAVIGVDAYVIDGHNPSADVGDWQFFSDINSERETAQIAELYYEQWFAEHRLRLKAGKWDVNNEFGYPADYGDGINAAAVFAPTFFPWPTYPDPATGVLAGWAPSESLTLNLAVLDGASWTGVHTGSLGPSTFFGAPSDLFWIGEAARRWTLGADERAGGTSLGAWFHTGDFTTTSGAQEQGTPGFYATLDQELSRRAEGGTTLGFLQLDWADADVAPVDLHLAAGLCARGLVSASPDDSFGGYVSWAHFSSGAGFTENAETAFELYYKWQCLAFLALQPDLQFITNPGGDETVGDALVFSLRTALEF